MTFFCRYSKCRRKTIDLIFKVLKSEVKNAFISVIEWPRIPAWYLKTVGFKFFAKIKITTKKEEADYCFFFLFMKIVLTIWQSPVCCTLISENDH